jgi:hypothetical protein
LVVKPITREALKENPMMAIQNAAEYTHANAVNIANKITGGKFGFEVRGVLRHRTDRSRGRRIGDHVRNHGRRDARGWCVVLRCCPTTTPSMPLSLR